jgi:hypothetical protein
MNPNYPVNKSVLNFIHAREFFPKGDAENYKLAVENLLHYYDMPYGKELVDFNMIFPDIDVMFSGLLGDFVSVDENKSGTFRIPYDDLIHFEEFDDLSEWRLAVALEDVIFKVYSHTSGAKNALEGYNFDYLNKDDWNVETVTILRQNDAIFYRPWIFHSFEKKLIHCYQLRGEFIDK